MRNNLSDKEIDTLNYLQFNGSFHPYTCDRKHDKCEVKIKPRDYKKDGVLIATEKGWFCPCGKYTQNYNKGIDV